MALKPRQRGRPQGRPGSFQRRLTWREVEAAFDHLFDVGLHDDEAHRIILRFKRARSQLLPVFSSMVVSPYERERIVALTVLERLGGSATVKMLDEILKDDDIHDAFKLDVRELRDLLEPQREAEPDEEEDEGEELLVDGEVAAAGDEEAEAGEAAEPTEGEAEGQRTGRRRAGRGRRGRRGRAGEAAEATEPAETGEAAEAPTAFAPADPAMFEGSPKAFLAALDGPIEPVLKAFAEVPLPKRLSFIDRSGRLDDVRVLNFLLPILDTDEWALVQSALRAVATLGRPEALPVVERLANDASRKRIKLRAERVLDQLRGGAPAPAEAEETGEEPLAAAVEAVEAEAEVPPEAEAQPEAEPAPSRGRGRRPRPLRRARPEVAGLPAQSDDAEARTPREPDDELAESGDLGLVGEALPDVAEPRGESLTAPERLPKLQACLAGPVQADGLQRLRVYRQGEDKTIDRLEVVIHDRAGWLDTELTRGLPTGQPKADQDRDDETWIETTVGYVRRRVSEALDRTRELERPLPRDAEAALGWIGTGRRVEVAAELPETFEAVPQEDVERLLDLPAFAGWRLGLLEEGQAVSRWLASTGKRSASRVRRRLIDEVVQAWVDTGVAAVLAERLRHQGLLLQRQGKDGAAAACLAVAATLAAREGRPEQNLFLREMVYRGFQASLDAAMERAARAERFERVRADRQRHARSSFRRALRKRAR